MAKYREALPQLSGELFLTDAGMGTDLLFNRGIEMPQFAAAHTLLSDPAGREALASYFRGFLSLARDTNTGFVLESLTWKAHAYWADDLGSSEQELQQSNKESIAFSARLRDEFASNTRPIVLDGVIGPMGDSYSPETQLAADEAERYHAQQIGWLVETDVDMVTAFTFTQSEEAIGVVRAAGKARLPVVMSFTVETDGNLPTGQPLDEAIKVVDNATDSGAAYFMVNCAHPDHFSHVMEDADWAHRIRGIRCNASRKSHAELNESDTLDDGDPVELGLQYKEIKAKMPWINIFGGCCGTDLRHITEIARALAT